MLLLIQKKNLEKNMILSLPVLHKWGLSKEVLSVLTVLLWPPTTTDLLLPKTLPFMVVGENLKVTDSEVPEDAGPG